jgi:hypothetical protein
LLFFFPYLRQVSELIIQVARLRIRFHLSEAEFGEVLGVVVESDDKHPTRSSPGSVGLPDVVVLVAGGVVAQAAAARRDGFFYDRAGLARVAGNPARRGITSGEDRQTLIPVQREFDRYGAARRHDVEQGRVVYAGRTR